MHESPDPRTSDRPGSTGLLLFLLLLGIVRLALTLQFPTELRDLAVDDRLFAANAAAIETDGWPSRYGPEVLIKSPGYPLFIALVRSTGMQLRVGRELLFLAGVLAVLAALRRLGAGSLAIGGGAVLLLFHPATLGAFSTRLLRESIYGSQILLLVGLGVLAFADRRILRRVSFLVFFSLILAWTWLTREESLWLLPPLALAALLDGIRARREGRWLPFALALLVPALFLLGARSVVMQLNGARLGARVVDETEDPDFVAAVDAVRRTAADASLPLSPIRGAKLETLYGLSPSLASLRGYLDSGAYRGSWATDRNGDRSLNMFTWALRAAAAATGRYADAETARRFWRQMAAEIHTAAERGEIEALSRRDSLLPDVDAGRSGALLASCGEALRAVAMADLLPRGTGPSLPVVRARGDDLELLRRATGEGPEPPQAPFFRARRLWLDLAGMVGRTSPGLWLLAVVGLGLALRRRQDAAGSAGRGAAILVIVAVAATRALLLGALRTLYIPSALDYLPGVMPLAVPAAVLGWVQVLESTRGLRRSTEEALGPRRIGAGRTLLAVALMLTLVWRGVVSFADSGHELPPRAGSAAAASGSPCFVEADGYQVDWVAGEKLRALPLPVPGRAWRGVRLTPLAPELPVRSRASLGIRRRLTDRAGTVALHALGSLEGRPFDWLETVQVAADQPADLQLDLDLDLLVSLEIGLEQGDTATLEITMPHLDPKGQ